MKEKLKTLNDFIGETIDNEYRHHHEAMLRLIRAEAVNDIKLIKEAQKDGSKIPLTKELCNVIEYIKWKNNLIEEDLE